ncbi:hypothetical protein VaNZ11_015447 [Volvox africanus]|uniref:tRNA/rRNA methyltransferase SpoU type domain-containing protein n=1 Tax=Volvox africanus TaxID=51714 RepID=A0ABQ5SKL7_9CHLO|nr:hypothetical protein VaNZ11_015447 [Volvox africanus]
MAPFSTSGRLANHPKALREICRYCWNCAAHTLATSKRDKHSGCRSVSQAYIFSAAPRPTQHARASFSTVSSGCVPAVGTAPPPSSLSDLLLSDVRVVLVSPKHEANVGAVARACANFECLSLFLVAPRCSITTGGTGAGASEARKVSCGDAVLDRIVVTDTLAEALADTSGSIGFTRRAGATRVTYASLGHLLAEFPWALPLQALPPSPPANASESLAAVPAKGLPVFSASLPPPLNGLGQAAPQERDLVSLSDEREGDGPADPSCNWERHPFVTALVFGREESGLTETELRLCSHACAIPTGRLQPSMNLSHAVAVALGEIFSRRCGLMNVALPAAATRNDSGVSSADGGEFTASQAWYCLSVPSAPGTCANNVAAAAAAVASSGRETSLSGSRVLDASLLAASAQEVDLLMRKVAAVAEAVGMRGEEGIGGGSSGNHGRRRLPVGHLRSVLSRARINAAESRSLHGLASAVLQQLDPDNPLEARKMRRKQQHAHKGDQQAHQPDSTEVQQQVHQAQ